MSFFVPRSAAIKPPGLAGHADPRVELEKVDLLFKGFKLAILSTLTGPILVASSVCRVRVTGISACDSIKPAKAKRCILGQLKIIRDWDN
jgi:hypothetical protein